MLEQTVQLFHFTVLVRDGCLWIARGGSRISHRRDGNSHKGNTDSIFLSFRVSKSPLISLQPYKALLTWKEYKADEFDIRQLITALENNLKTELAYMARDIMQSKRKAIADSNGGETRWGSKLFQFHAVFGNIWQNIMLAPPEGWRPHSGKSWIRHWISSLSFFIGSAWSLRQWAGQVSFLSHLPC